MIRQICCVRTVIAVFASLTMFVAPSAAAEQPHWAFQLAVDAPTAVGHPFVANITLTLVGPQTAVTVPGEQTGVIVPTVTVTFSVLAIAPDGKRRVLADHATQSGEITGATDRLRLSFQPSATGEWMFPKPLPPRYQVSPALQPYWLSSSRHLARALARHRS